MPRKPKITDDPIETPFADLPTLALERLANALSRHGELMYQRLFGLHLSECRVLAVVLTREPTSLGEVCEQLELDKGYVSRLVARLVVAGLLDRHADAADQRSSHLVLTPTGRETALQIRTAATSRSRDWMKALGGAEPVAFLEAVARMTVQAREMLADEVSLSDGRGPPRLSRTREAGAGSTRRVRPLVVERPVLEEMRRQLDRLLDGDIPGTGGQ